MRKVFTKLKMKILWILDEAAKETRHRVEKMTDR